VHVAVGMGEGYAENDDGGEADDEESESAHGADLAGYVRGRRHGSSLSLRLGDPIRWIYEARGGP
jgi:hypothetical protein